MVLTGSDQISPGIQTIYESHQTRRAVQWGPLPEHQHCTAELSLNTIYTLPFLKPNICQRFTLLHHIMNNPFPFIWQKKDNHNCRVVLSSSGIVDLVLSVIFKLISYFCGHPVWMDFGDVPTKYMVYLSNVWELVAILCLFCNLASNQQERVKNDLFMCQIQYIAMYNPS